MVDTSEVGIYLLSSNSTYSIENTYLNTSIIIEN